jgi:ferredoxin-NADP reductase
VTNCGWEKFSARYSTKAPAFFIAGGTGITPFTAIFRHLYRDNQFAGNSLIFSNKTQADIIVEKECSHYLGDRHIFTLMRKSTLGYYNSRVNRDFLLKHLNSFEQRFYLCGPEKFVEELSNILKTLGTQPDSIVFEEE